MQPQSEVRGWAQRGVWLICIGVYLTVFVGGIQGGGNDLMAMGRAVAFTLLAGVLGKTAIGFLSRATVAEDAKEEGPSADEVGPVGSLVDLMASANVPEHEELAEAA